MENNNLGNSKKSFAKKSFLMGLTTGLLICVTVLGIALAGRFLMRYVSGYLPGMAGGQSAPETGVMNDMTIQKIETIEEIINKNFYKTDITTKQLADGLYKGLVSALADPYAEYYTEEELTAVSSSIEGVTYGIGAYISYDEEMELAVISGVIEGGSAAESDLREGDYILKVDDVDVQGYTSSEVVMLVRGQENTTVHLTIYREEEPDFLEFDLVRKKALEKATVAYGMMEDDIGYVRIEEFDDVTVDQYTEAMAVLKEEGIKGMVLDLRSNPGGNLSSVTEIARKILPEGLIVYTEDRSGRREEYTCDGKNEWQLPLAVLVNEYSASAAEILAGAIQDYEKGTIIGTSTYGKGVVQRIITLSDNTAVKLTVSSYYTPLGQSLGGVGVTPDIELDLDQEAYYEEETDNQLDRAIEVVKEGIE